ncbi:MAG: FAD:protein FMN transferase, partial [Campylobacterota bacterium]|nr:FAD:protein FMN transferase [Campylobacterota bacterium]
RKKESLKEFIGCEHFSIKKNKIRFDNPHTKIDLGGFVKEYAVDRAVEVLQKNKISSALVNFGGDVYALSKKPDNSQYSIGIKDPSNPTSFATQVFLEDEALTTSASYERNYKVGATKYSHIISKEQLQKNVNSVSVISKNCVESGVYSTSLMIDETIENKNRVIFL